MSEAFFKVRQTKRSNPESRTTLDSIHKVHLTKLIDEYTNLEEVEKYLRNLKETIDSTQDEIEKIKYEKEYQNLLRDYKLRKSGTSIYDYYLNTGDLLYQYYDIQEKINSGVESKKNNSLIKPGNILDVIYTSAQEDQHISSSSFFLNFDDIQPVKVKNTDIKNEEVDLCRDKILESYLQKVDPEHARGYQKEEHHGICDTCGKEMYFSMNDAMFTCPTCGYQEFVLIDSDKPSYKDPPREISYYAYKRINHFNEWLAQIQAKESTEIPKEVYEAILVELKKERILDTSVIKTSKIREILKKLKFNKYYEHAAHIMNRINGKNAPVITRETEEKLRHMFIEIQPSFQKHCPEMRSNFLSYSYVLYKFCELLELDEYLPNFPILKDRDKLFCQDKIWQKICSDLKWQYLKSC